MPATVTERQKTGMLYFMLTYLRERLQQRRQQSLYRRRLIHHTPQSPLLCIAGRKYLNFCSNDYLGLAAHPRITKALRDGAETYATGAGASHLINGHSIAHHRLEDVLAEYTGRQRALLFSTGYMANLAVISALTERHDALFMDKLNHASLLDGAALSKARLQRYPHNDTVRLEALLEKSTARHKLIASDGVFSMDGDLAALPQILPAAQRHNAWLILDDAHGLGVVGHSGRGCCEYYGLTADDVPVLVGTLGKAFGVFGAFVAGSEELIEYLIQFARSYIYTTALPPALACAALEAVRLAGEEAWRREVLYQRIAQFRQAAEQCGLPLSASPTPIQPLFIGDNADALAISRKLYEGGILLSAIRPPTVPAGSARLRVTLSAAHTPEQVDSLVEKLAAAFPPK